MSVNHEVKGMLAKLLATEDIVVEHRKVKTAQFNVHTRVLTLPLWDKASNVVYDLLVAHECGHSIFTPDVDWTKSVNISMQYVNIVEDARIEKLMKRKYMGLAKTFFNGYKELKERDFFQIAGDDISKLGFADRVNLYFKIGNLIVLNFNPEEKEIIDLIASAETFDDVLFASEKLYKYCKKQKKKENIKEEETFNPNDYLNEMDQDFSEDCDEEEDEESSDGKNNDDENDQDEEDEDDESSGGKHDEDGDEEDEDEENEEDLEVRTVESFEKNLLSLLGNSTESVYAEVPQVNLDTVVAKNEDIHEVVNKHFNMQQRNINESSERRKSVPNNLYKDPDDEYKKFKTSAQKEVNYLVKEFECRKSADQYARATTARTGVLDTTKLHTYKYNEDLFRKVTVLPDGKNHGLIFVLDWSGSMYHVMKDTCKQLFNLIWFCKKVSIPFEVYAFTNEWNRSYRDEETGEVIAADFKPHYKVKERLLCVSDDFSMMNILTSKVSSKELEKQMINIWRLASFFSTLYGVRYTIPDRLILSGTPLNQALVSLYQILPNFQKDNKLQKVQCVVLTDGEANPLQYHYEVQRKWEKEPYMGVRRLSPDRSFIRDRRLGTTYKVGHEDHTFTDALLRNLKDKFPMTNFIGIRVLESGSIHNFMKLYYNSYSDDMSKLQSEWKKQKSFCIRNSGYDAYFGISANALAQETEFEVEDNATKSQIKSAFVKSLRVKKLNKKVLGEFISLVA